MAVPKRTAPAHNAGINFGSSSMYVAGGGLPEGDYAFEFTVQMYQAVSQAGVSKGPARLGVMVTAHSLDDPQHQGENARQQFYSMGSNADKSFAPNPETAKGLIQIPGGAGMTLPQNTNWDILRKSLYDCGLPEGIFTDDLSVLDGVHVHVSNIPEPEERKSFGSAKTGEAQEERRAGTIAVVTEIKDDGKPWEGTGGIPSGTAAPAKPAAKPASKPVPIRGKATPAPAPAAEETDVKTEAINYLSSVLEKYPDGTVKLKLRTEVFKLAKEGSGDDVAAAIIETYFSSDDALNSLLGEVGYVVDKAAIKPV